MSRKPFAHQKRVFNRIKSQSQVALFLEMRLGKTFLTIQWATFIGAKRILVLAPLSVLATWWDELGLEGKQRCQLHGLAGGEIVKLLPSINRVAGPVWHTLTYDSCHRRPSVLEYPWDLVVLDESVAIKNPKGKIGTNLIKHFEDVPYKAILSGLPDPEGPLDLFQQFKFLYGSFMGCKNFWQWQGRHFHLNELERYVTKPGHLKEIKTATHNRAVILTRDQAGLGSRKIYETRHTPLDASTTKEYKATLKDFAYKGKETSWKLVVDTWLARIAGGPHKEKELLYLLQNQFRHEKVVIWYRFNQELFQCKRLLRSHGLGDRIRSIVGRTPPRKRAARAQWLGRKGRRILLCQAACSKFGVDLAAADTAIYYSNYYSHNIRAQSEDRIIHPTKKQPVLYLDLLTPRTIDEAAYRVLRGKKCDAVAFKQALLTEFKKAWYMKG